MRRFLRGLSSGMAGAVPSSSDVLMEGRRHSTVERELFSTINSTSATSPIECRNATNPASRILLF